MKENLKREERNEKTLLRPTWDWRLFADVKF